MKTVYAAGPITGISYGVSTSWRTELQKLLPFNDVVIMSPLRSKTYLAGETEIKDHYDQIMSTQRGITTRDRWDCMSCDAVVINLLGAGRVSIGTMIEVGWCDSRRIPIILVMEEEGNIHEHAMLRECSSFRVKTLAEAAHVISSLFNLRCETCGKYHNDSEFCAPAKI